MYSFMAHNRKNCCCHLLYLSGAITNVVYRITWPCNTAGNDERTVLLWIYGDRSDIFFEAKRKSGLLNPFRPMAMMYLFKHFPSIFNFFVTSKRSVAAILLSEPINSCIQRNQTIPYNPRVLRPL